MNSSLKIGAVSGLIAGFVAGIVFCIVARIVASMGLWMPIYGPIIPDSVGVNITFAILFGIVLGMIFSKTCFLIPGRDALKGLTYGLVLLVIVNVRIDTFWAAYSYYSWIAGDLLSWPIVWVVYGLVLGFLYEFIQGRYYPAKEEPKTITYNMESGVLPGAVAGICGGIVASIVAILGPAMGLWKLPSGPVTLTFDFWMGQAGAHLFINMLWGVIFGSIFPRVYNLVPWRGLRKGIYYGMTVFLIGSFQFGAYALGWDLLHNLFSVAASVAGGIWVMGAAQAFTFGLVLGALYKK